MLMIIATWNVNSGKIADRLTELRTVYHADVVAMQETAEPPVDSACSWSGDLKHKGVSLSTVLPYKRADIPGESSPCIAATVTDETIGEFNVLAVWAKPTPTYFADLSRTFDLYSQFIRERPTVILGDFNMSVRVHSKGKQFYLLNARLNHDFDIHSVYHENTGERFGMETMTTLYWQWGASGCFHCDFIYIPGSWIRRLKSVTIPGYSKFTSSDHRPVLCEIT
jgi:endonuclease/exonuclease/phosphatase family metal-dependent hydrolase